MQLRPSDIQPVMTAAAAAWELLRRRKGREGFKGYIEYTDPAFIHSAFSDAVCVAVDKFIADVLAGKRPILILQAPPQHGKSDLISRKLPAYLAGCLPNLRVGALSYADVLVSGMAQSVRRNISSDEHSKLFPPGPKRKYDIDQAGEFSFTRGTGSYYGTGVGGGLTGRPLDVGIIDDPIKNEKEALSPTVKEGHWNWYQSVFTTRLSENSGQIIMATSWAEDDLVGRVADHYEGDARLTVLRFPAINDPDEVGYNPALPLGALVPGLKSMAFLLEVKKLFSDYWWSAMYQQSPKALGGNVFKDFGIQYYRKEELPAKFDRMIISWDMTFKDTDGTDFVVGQAWGKKGANSYLLHQIRERMSFTKTCQSVKDLHTLYPGATKILVEDKANGPAVIDALKDVVPGLIPVEPDGSKLARAHAVTGYWEAKNVWLPHPDDAPWVKALTKELTTFPAAANDDQVDSFSQALRELYPLFKGLNISEDVIRALAQG